MSTVRASQGHAAFCKNWSCVIATVGTLGTLGTLKQPCKHNY